MTSPRSNVPVVRSSFPALILAIGFGFGWGGGCGGGGASSTEEAAATSGAAPASNPAPASTSPPATGPAAPVEVITATTGPPAPAAASPAPETPSGPQLTFATTVCEVGLVWDGAPKYCHFQFTNTGTEDLHILTLKTACTCTAAALDKRRYAPGEGGVIDVTYTSAGKGEQRQLVHVISNAGPPTRLTVHAEVKPLLTIEPDVIRFSGQILGTTQTRTIRVTPNLPGYSIDMVTATSTIGGPEGWGPRGDFLSARVLDPEPSDGRGAPRAIPVEVTLDGTTPWGMNYGIVTISGHGPIGADGAIAEHEATVHAVATVFGEIQATDTMFRIGTVASGTAIQQRIQLARSSREPFSIVDVRIIDANVTGLTVSAVPLNGGAVNEIYLVGVVSGPHQVVSGTVEIRTDVPGEERLEIRLGGMIRDVNK